MTAPAYVTRETVLDVGGFGSSMASKIDRAIFSRSRYIERRTHRHFYPKTAAVTYDDPQRITSMYDGYGLHLERDLRSVTTVTVGGTATSDYTALPKGGPPYNRLIVSGPPSLDLIITGVWGWSADTEAAGTITGDIASTTAATCDCSNSAAIGVGDLITINSERMIVTDKTPIDTAEDLDGALQAQTDNVTVTVTDGSGFTAGEEILVDAERMLIEDVTGNDLTVQRAHRGSTLAAHSTAADVYAYRRLHIDRGAAGSTADTHNTSDTITRNVPPPEIRDWCLAEVLNQVAQEAGGYARVVGSGDNQREARGPALADLRKSVGGQYRRVRMGTA